MHFLEDGFEFSDERCCVATKLSDDGVAGAERHIEIAGILRKGTMGRRKLHLYNKGVPG